MVLNHYKELTRKNRLFWESGCITLVTVYGFDSQSRHLFGNQSQCQSSVVLKCFVHISGRMHVRELLTEANIIQFWYFKNHSLLAAPSKGIENIISAV